MPIVEIQNVGEIEFPDDMAPEDIQAAIQRDILPSKTGSFLRETARSVLPAVAGIAVAPFATAAAAPVTGAAAPVVGIGSGLATALGVRKAQDELADKFFPNSFMGTKSAQLDAATNPVSAMFGGVVAGGRPSLRNAQSVGRLLSAEGRQLAAQGFQRGATGEAATMASRLFDVGVSGGVNAGMSAAQGNDVGQIARDAALGMVFSKPWIGVRQPQSYSAYAAEQKANQKKGIPSQESSDHQQLQESDGMPSVPIQRGAESIGDAPFEPTTEGVENIFDPNDILGQSGKGTEEMHSLVRELPSDAPRESTASDTPPANFESNDQSAVPVESPEWRVKGPTPRAMPGYQRRPLAASKSEMNSLELQEAADAAVAQQAKIDRFQDSVFRSDPLVKFIMDQGGLRSKTAQARVHGGIKKGAGEYDSATRLRDTGIYSPDSGIHPDNMAQMAYEEGVLDEPSADALWRALDRVNSGSKRMERQAADYEARMANEEARAMQDMRTNGAPLDVDDLEIGHVLQIPQAQGGGRMRVVDVSPEGEVTLQMPNGSVQKIPSGTQLMSAGWDRGASTPEVSGEMEPF